MTTRENLLRAARFETPDVIPMTFHINDSCWHHYPQAALQELMVAHPLLFPGYQPVDRVSPVYAPEARADHPYCDPWGCVWETTDDGIVGAVTRHPLAEWEAFASYTPPDPAQVYDWQAISRNLQVAGHAGQIAGGGLPHGHTFLRLCDLRGYEQAILDMVDEEPRVRQLLAMIEEYNRYLVRGYLAGGAEWMGYPEDLGMQVGPMLSPAQFRAYIKPCYQRLMQPAREAGCIIHMHSDGDLHELVDELIDGGVDVINLQDLVNGLDWIAHHLAGRVCIDLDIDRQTITRFGVPAQIDTLIREEVTTLGRKEGGLMMIYGLYPGVPLENVKALMDAMERYAGYYA